ncbi:phosphotransferase family protein [Microlunatus soli]|uniref:Predicted kinase, aminoglycoside phosphotransferase (APT) family n=1 Tax=Microlunatus soli TaxID=630515 RepID=A0A1H1UQ50_9ACTN|nr:aminoglycoside phosphotransferase family protein [Microlunatus soli]SDS74678.1 Predicted kinase, aminoglycoside phosphotransferase (APT) family [Microlunatus soli]
MTRWKTSLTAEALDELVDRARQQLPQLDRSRPVLIGEGISTMTYGLSAPDGRWALRISRRYPEPWTWRGGRAHELDLIAELRRRGVPVPAGATVIAELRGLPAAILERRIEGEPLAPDLARGDAGLRSQIADLLDRLHSVDTSARVIRDLPRDDPTAEFRAAASTVQLKDRSLRRRVEAAIDQLAERGSIRTLCHRDFRVEHLIAADATVVGLLDLGEVGIDDPAIDLAFLHGELGADAVARICGAMETADPELHLAARTFHQLWPLLELVPGGESWGDPATARARLDALL